jgi:hypothetical protein
MTYWKRVILIIVALGIATIFLLFNYNNDQKATDEKVLKDHSIVARTFMLGVFYDSIEDPVDIMLYPSDETQPIMGRWKIISELLPEFEYPEEFIQNNNWIEVHNVLIANYEQYSESIKGKDLSSVVSLDAILYFIFENDVREDSPLEKLFEKKGIDYEKE